MTGSSLAPPGTLAPSAPEPKLGRLPAFDVLRAGAATLVFLYHYAGFAHPQSTGAVTIEFVDWLATRLGSIGTNLLLLLSGFFMAQSLASRRFTYRQFVSLRLVRIYVPYLIVLLAAVVFAHLRPGFSRADVSGLTLSSFLPHLVLFPGLFPAQPVLTVTWTLSFIVAGYLLFPLIDFALHRGNVQRPGRLVAWAALTALCFAAGLFGGMASIRFSYVPAGCLVYELQARTNWERARSGTLRALLAVAALYLVLRVLLDGNLLGTAWHPLVRRAAFSVNGLVLTSTLVAIALIVQRRYRPARRNRLLHYVAGFGRTGYSFYLLHGPVVKLFALLVFPPLVALHAPASVYWLLMPICWLLAAAGALILYRAVERPCRRLLMRSLGGSSVRA
ncbi:MAG: acyltransferase [Bryobacterales bacterium]|nr:acyltransferase [Bryobacterales bacterium]